MNMSHAKRRTIKRNTLKPDIALDWRHELSHKQRMAQVRLRVQQQQRHMSPEEDRRKLDKMRVRVFKERQHAQDHT